MEVFREIGCEFIAACNRSEGGRKKAETEGKIKKTYHTALEMIQKEKPDGIVCCASFDEIFNITRKIIPAGIPMLIEKPPGTSLSEYLELRDLYQKYKTPIMVGTNRRHYSVFQKAIEDAGGIKSVQAVFVNWSESPEHFRKRGFTDDQIKKMIFGNSLHGIDLLVSLSGRIKNADTICSNPGNDLRWMMSLHGISENGVLASFQSTWDSPGGWQVTICSQGKRYIFSPLEKCIVTNNNKEQKEILPDACDLDFKPGFYQQATLFKQTIEGKVENNNCLLDNMANAMELAQQLTACCLHE